MLGLKIEIKVIGNGLLMERTGLALITMDISTREGF